MCFSRPWVASMPVFELNLLQILAIEHKSFYHVPIFIAAMELPKPQPYRCPCRNGGQCVEEASSSRVICRCPKNYSGLHCMEYSPQADDNSKIQSGSEYLIFLGFQRIISLKKTDKCQSALTSPNTTRIGELGGFHKLCNTFFGEF